MLIPRRMTNNIIEERSVAKRQKSHLNVEKSHLNVEKSHLKNKLHCFCSCYTVFVPENQSILTRFLMFKINYIVFVRATLCLFLAFGTTGGLSLRHATCSHVSLRYAMPGIRLLEWCRSLGWVDPTTGCRFAPLRLEWCRVAHWVSLTGCRFATLRHATCSHVSLRYATLLVV